MAAIQVEIKNGKAYIASPYNVEFVRRIKLSGGRDGVGAPLPRHHLPQREVVRTHRTFNLPRPRGVV